MKLGIIQGRLSPPEHGVIQSFPSATWQAEFDRARMLGLDHIEWLFDRFTGFGNPIFDDDGRARIKLAAETAQVAVQSLCADYFRDYPLKNITEVRRLGLDAEFERLLRACSDCGITRVMIPYVDHSKIESDRELDEVSETLACLLSLSSAKGMTISLETNLGPPEYKRLLEQVGNPSLKVNYDIGDAAALGHDAAEEISALSPWLCNVHVKDRVRGGGTVPLGTGDANFRETFRLLKNAGYHGRFVLQGARGADDVETVRQYTLQVQDWLRDAGF